MRDFIKHKIKIEEEKGKPWLKAKVSLLRRKNDVKKVENKERVERTNGLGELEKRAIKTQKRALDATGTYLV